MSVDNQEDWLRRVDQQSPKELDEHRGIDAPLGQHEAELTLGTDRRDQVGAEPRASAGDHRGLASLPPGCATVIVRADARLVGEEDLRTCAFCATPDRGIVRLQPPFQGSADTPATAGAARLARAGSATG